MYVSMGVPRRSRANYKWEWERFFAKNCGGLEFFLLQWMGRRVYITVMMIMLVMIGGV